MDPKVWGRNMWTSLVHITIGYPNNPNDTIKKQYLVYFTSLGFVLPCEACKVHYKQNIHNHQVQQQDRDHVHDEYENPNEGFPHRNYI